MTKTVRFKTEYRKLLADAITPVSAYLRTRDLFPGAHLLESADFSSEDECSSYILLDPIAEFRLTGLNLKLSGPASGEETIKLDTPGQAKGLLKQFLSSFKPDQDFPIVNGAFGFSAYEAVSHFEEIKLKQRGNSELPTILYQVFRYIIGINHLKGELSLLKNHVSTESDGTSLDELIHIITQRSFPNYGFKTTSDLVQQTSDKNFEETVLSCKKHIQRGDVFQIVPSIRFSQKFQGDEFNVYRALRSINPSPYLFYFDFGSFKLFGSSPEAQLSTSNRVARLQPIAGTCPRSKSKAEDAGAIAGLLQDPKESAEHVMLVDLARNDLGKLCSKVRVKNFKEPKLYSHVIHLTSSVEADIPAEVDAVDIFAATFPMGTVSGAPKYRAMQLIDEFEPSGRGVYGGAVGYFGFNGDSNHAIIIRSALSHNNELSFQAGAGIVADSSVERELHEIKTKIAAMTASLLFAGELE